MNATTPNERTRRPARRALAAAALLVLGAVALPSVAAVYKWIDPKGEIHYSDRPPPPEGKLLSIDTSAQHSHERGPEPAPRASTPAPLGAPGTPNAALSPEAAAKLKQNVDNDVSSARADQCKQAQDKYQNYIHSRRLYKEGPNKERIYLSDQELETERLNAKHEVDELCGTGSG
ncbi:MAG TPA: DUF4124 domain-containing protein [Steroidobacteraceae bacterium]|nr:DUF4124 domain-containing protein [Steroidobacteraceae bacterium]